MLKRGSITKLFDPSDMTWHEVVVLTPNVLPPALEVITPPKPLLFKYADKNIADQSDGVAFRMIIQKVTGVDPEHLYNDHNHNNGTKRLKAYNFSITADEGAKIIAKCRKVFGARLVESGRTKEWRFGPHRRGNDLFIRLKVSQ